MNQIQINDNVIIQFDGKRKLAIQQGPTVDNIKKDLIKQHDNLTGYVTNIFGNTIAEVSIDDSPSIVTVPLEALLKLPDDNKERTIDKVRISKENKLIQLTRSFARNVEDLNIRSARKQFLKIHDLLSDLDDPKNRGK